MKVNDLFNMLVDKLFIRATFTDHTDVLNKHRLKNEFKHPYQLASNDIFVGIEVEVERIMRQSHFTSLGDSVYIWRNVEDGSLRNNGRELVSIPIKGDNIPYALSVLEQTLTKDKNCIGHEFTDRTSVHIHMDVRSLTMEHLMNLVLTYIMVEPLLYRFCGGDRHNNIFCVPVNLSTMGSRLKNMFSNFEKGSADALHTISRWPKYTGLNLKSVQTYGTVEFRHMVGTRDVTKLVRWINLLMRLRLFSENQNYFKLKNRILEMNTTSEYRNFLFEIFGGSLEDVSTNKLESYMEEMVIFIKDIFLAGVENNQSFITENLNAEIAKIFDKTLFSAHAFKCGFLHKEGDKPKKSASKRMIFDTAPSIQWAFNPPEQEAENPLINDHVSEAENNEIGRRMSEERISTLAQKNRVREAAGLRPTDSLSVLDEAMIMSGRNYQRILNDIRREARLAPADTPELPPPTPRNRGREITREVGLDDWLAMNTAFVAGRARPAPPTAAGSTTTPAPRPRRTVPRSPRRRTPF